MILGVKERARALVPVTRRAMRKEVVAMPKKLRTMMMLRLKMKYELRVMKYLLLYAHVYI